MNRTFGANLLTHQFEVLQEGRF